MILLVRSKGYYAHANALLLLSSFATFASALYFVPQDEFRIVWFYLLMFVAYITGGTVAGLLVTLASIAIILVMSYATDLMLAPVTLRTALTGLTALSLLTYIFTLRMSRYERLLLRQRKTLSIFNASLEQEVELKTATLQRLNDSLETRIAQKITEVKLQEKMLLAQSRLAAIGEMLSMVTHQWRQPLSTISLMISRLNIEMLLSGKAPENARLLDDITDILGTLSGMIDDYQTYFDPEDVHDALSLEETFRHTLHFTQPRLQQHRVHIDIAPPPPYTVKEHARELIQCLVNLVNNAIDSVSQTHDGSKTIRINARTDDTGMAVSVEDDGSGIAPELTEKIFRPYFSTKSGGHLGLGLSMVEMIVKNRLGGTIRVENTGHGTRFTIHLPKRVPDATDL